MLKLCCIFSILRCLKLNPNSKHSNAKPVHTARGLHRTHSCHLWRIHQLSQTLSSFGWAILRCNPTTIWPKRSCPKLSDLQLNHFPDENKDHLIDSHSTLTYFDGMYNYVPSVEVPTQSCTTTIQTNYSRHLQIH